LPGAASIDEILAAQAAAVAASVAADPAAVIGTVALPVMAAKVEPPVTEVPVMPGVAPEETSDRPWSMLVDCVQERFMQDLRDTAIDDIGLETLM